MWLDELVEMKRRSGKTLKQIAEESHTPIGTINKLFSGQTADPKLATIRAVVHCLGYTLDDLFDSTEKENAPAISTEAEEIAKRYAALPEDGQGAVKTILSYEETRTNNKQTAPVTELPQTKIIPLLGTSAAAGPGEPDTGLDFTPYEVPGDSRAEFAVRITGDSMEPHLHDGDVALCLKRDPEIGEIAVMMVNGSLLVKQYITDGYNIYLRSLNRKRKECDYDIWHTGSDTVRCYGTVIMQKIPLVKEWG